MEKKFDHDNFCVAMGSDTDVMKLENILKAIRPADYSFTFPNEFSLYTTPFLGVLDGELHFSHELFGEEYKLSELAMNIIKWKLEGVLKAQHSVIKWSPTMGEMLKASMTGNKFREAVFMYSIDNTHYCVNHKDYTPTQLESGQYIIKLIAYRHIKPLYA